jgi:cardiolipin synthase
MAHSPRVTPHGFFSRFKLGASTPSPPRPHRRRKQSWWLLLIAGLVTGGYYWITSAPVLSQPVVLDYGPLTPAFADSSGPLLSAPFVPGNRITLYSNGDEFFPAMLADIRAARKTVTLEAYIWSSGLISNQFIAALGERARAGVKVHVLVDGMGMRKLSLADQNRMIDAGIEFVAYGHEHWWQLKTDLNHRTHRKLLIIDGRTGYTGGVCFDDAWMGHADSLEHWREIQLRAEGPVVLEMQSVFVTNWLKTTGRLLLGPAYFLPPGQTGEALALCYKSGPHEGAQNARISYLLAIASARSSIRIAHAYFMPDDLAVDMLVAARARGVTVDVIVPALNDSSFGRAASRSRWGRLLDAGVKFHRFLPSMYHAKMMIVDDGFVTLGSVNFDGRSLGGMNDEANVNVLDRGVAAQALRLFNQDLAHSEEVTPARFAARPAWRKLTDDFCGLFRWAL